MEEITKRRRFLINLLYWAAILAIVYLCFRYLLKLLMPFVIALLVAWILRPLCRLYKRRDKSLRLYTALVVATVLLFLLFKVPLAALRGLAKSGSPSCSRSAFRRSKELQGIRTSPRISN